MWNHPVSERQPPELCQVRENNPLGKLGFAVGARTKGVWDFTDAARLQVGDDLQQDLEHAREHAGVVLQVGIDASQGLASGGAERKSGAGTHAYECCAETPIAGWGPV